MLRRLPNLTNALVLGGVVALGIAMYLPAETAERAAKVETRAEEAGRALLRVGIEFAPRDEPIASARAQLLTAFRSACEQIGHPSSYLPDTVDPPGSLDGLDCALFESKHYCFMLVRGDPRPPEEASGEVVAEPAESQPTGSQLTESQPTTRPASPPTIRPFEVYAWPQSLRPPGHSAFFFPEQGEASFSRNLMHQYVGWDESRRRAEMPRPGAGVPKKPREKRSYRGRDDERWLVFFGDQ